MARVARAGISDALHLLVDPAFARFGQRLDGLPDGRDRLPDDDRNHPGVAPEGVLGPELARVQRHRQDRHAEIAGQPGAARLEAALAPGQDARALGEDDDPETLADAVPTLLDQLLVRLSERLIRMGDNVARPQPKKGTQASSRFATHTWGGNICE